MEAAIRNCVGRRVLCLVCGAFSARFFEIAEACGVEADRLDVEWGESNEPAELAEALAQQDYDAVSVVHSELGRFIRLAPPRSIRKSSRP